MTDSAKTETWQCTRCLWILTGREGDEIAEHGAQCPFHGTGDDPEVGHVQVGGAGSKRFAVQVATDEKPPRWQCGRCDWIADGKVTKELPEHSPACRFRDTGTDPTPGELTPHDGL